MPRNCRFIQYLIAVIGLPDNLHFLPRLHFINIHVQVVVKQLLGFRHTHPLIEQITQQGIRGVGNRRARRVPNVTKTKGGGDAYACDTMTNYDMEPTSDSETAAPSSDRFSGERQRHSRPGSRSSSNLASN